MIATRPTQPICLESRSNDTIPCMKITISQNGLMELPEELRQQDGVAPGQCFEVRRIGAGCYLLDRESTGLASRPVRLLDWLRACPADDWYSPMPSESTDEL